LQASIVYGGIKAEQDGFGQPEVGKFIALEMHLLQAKENFSDTNIVGGGVGKGNMFYTVMAFDEALRKGKIGSNSKEAFNRFLEANIGTMYQEYMKMPKPERTKIINIIQKSRKEGGYGSFEDTFKLFPVLFDEILNAAEINKQQLNDAAITKILQTKSVEPTQQEETEEPETAEVDSATFSTVALLQDIPEPTRTKFSVGEIRTGDGKDLMKYRRYKELVKAAEKYEKRKESFEKIKQISTPVQIETYEKTLEIFQNKFQTLYDEYAKLYLGEKE